MVRTLLFIVAVLLMAGTTTADNSPDSRLIVGDISAFPDGPTAEASPNPWAVWVMADEDTINVRGGYRGFRQYPNAELGAMLYWFKETDPPRVFGLYGAYHVPTIVQIPNPLPFDWLPETFKGEPYVGIELSVNIPKDGHDGKADKKDGWDKRMSNIFAGLKIEHIGRVEAQLFMVDDGMEAFMSDDIRFRIGLGVDGLGFPF